jgi:hypothetical protein
LSKLIIALCAVLFIGCSAPPPVPVTITVKNSVGSILYQETAPDLWYNVDRGFLGTSEVMDISVYGYTEGTTNLLYSIAGTGLTITQEVVK